MLICMYTQLFNIIVVMIIDMFVYIGHKVVTSEALGQAVC